VIALDRILARIPKERHESILRVAHDLNIPPDSIDLTQAYLAVEAVSPLLDEMRKIAADLPTAMKASGIEIVRGLSDKIASETTKQIADTGIAILRARTDEFFAASGNQLVQTLAQFGNGCADALQSLDARTNLAAGRIEDAAGKSERAAEKVGSEGHHGANQMRAAGDEVRIWWKDHVGRLFLIAIAMCMALAMASSGLTYYFGYKGIYHAGYMSGAQVERTAHGWRQR
jgi:hypothetical protein